MEFEPKKMMDIILSPIGKPVFLIADVDDWSIEADYAYAKGIPIISTCSVDKKMANTGAGLVKNVLRYVDYVGLDRQPRLLFV